MDDMTSGLIFVEPIPGAPEPKPVFRHEGITFVKSFWKVTTTITIDAPEIAAHSFLPNVTITLIKNGEFLPVSNTEKQIFVMKRNDNWAPGDFFVYLSKLCGNIGPIRFSL